MSLDRTVLLKACKNTMVEKFVFRSEKKYSEFSYLAPHK